MKTTLNIPLIFGASRPERRSERVANFLFQELQKLPDITTTFVDVRDFQLEYDDDKPISKFHDLVTAADAFLLVFPEYNHAFPGKLKTLLDTEFNEYKHKPVALSSVSSGQFGGVRAVELLTPVLTNFKLIVTGLNLHFPNVEQAFDDLGNPTDSKAVDRAQKIFSELIYLTKVIKAGKEAVQARTR